MKFTLYVEDDSNNLVINCLELTAIRKTMDMSVANARRESAFYPFREIGENVGKEIALMKYCSPRIESVTENEVTVSWMEKSYTLHLGDDVDSEEYAIDNPRLSWDGISLNMKYSSINAWEEFFTLVNEIVEDQHQCPQRQNKEEKEKCLKLLYEIILNGENAVRPFYAWLQSCNNWDTLIIDDYALFAQHLDINDSDCSPTWFSNLMQVLGRNDIDAIQDAVPSLKAVIEKAAKEGIEEAIQIQNGTIEQERLAERYYPDLKEPVLTLKMFDEEDDEITACHFKWVTSDMLKSGQKFDMGNFGEVTIVAAEKEMVKISWLGNEMEVNEGYTEHFMDSEVRPNAEEIEGYDTDAWAKEIFYTPTRYLKCKYHKLNLWVEALGAMDKVLDPVEECLQEREEYVKVAKHLLEILIERGDEKLQIVHDAISIDSKYEEIEELINSIE